MLILSRKTNQQIVIGQNVVITVVAISPGQVRLGIEAPREIPVHRKEVQRAIMSPAPVESGATDNPLPAAGAAHVVSSGSNQGVPGDASPGTSPAAHA
jgi:carbon storage regulator